MTNPTKFLIVLALLAYSYLHAISIETTVTEPILITNSNQTLSDQFYRLAAKADCPVIIIGNESGPPITNITLTNIKIDGDSTNQTKELYKYSERGLPINNNGIIIQNAKDVVLNYVTIVDCRSGGLVTTLGVSRLFVTNLLTTLNMFDGIACYKTTDSVFRNITSIGNAAAGLSFDLEFNSNVVDHAIIALNSVGIFARDSYHNNFTNIIIGASSLYTLFLAPIDDLPNTGASYNNFSIHPTTLPKVYTNSACIGNVIDIIPMKREDTAPKVEEDPPPIPQTI